MRVCLLILVAPTLVFAQDHILSNWTLTQYLQKSLEASESLAEQDLALQKSRAARDEQRALFYPAISASAQSSKTDTWGSEASDSSNNLRTLTSLTLSQNLFNGFHDRFAYTSAASIAEQNEYLLKNSKRAQVQSAIDEFFAVMQYQSDIENLHQEISFNEQSLKTAQRNIRAGNARQTQVISLQSTLAANHLELASAQSLLIAEQTKIARQLKADTNGLSFSYKLRFDPGKIDFCVANLNSNTREDLLAQRAYTQAIEDQLKSVRAIQLPKLDLDASYTLTDSQKNPTLKNQYTVTAALTVPLPLGAQKQAQIAQARVSYEMAQKSEIEKSLDLESQKNQLINDLSSDLAQLRALAESTKLSNQNVVAIRSDHKVGLSSYSEVLAAFSTYQQVLRKYDRAKLTFERDCYRALIWSQDSDQLISTIEGVQK